MKSKYIFKIYQSTQELPKAWSTLAKGNIFFSENYLNVLEFASPDNMQCHFIGIFDRDDLKGIAIAQFLNINTLKSFGERDKCFKSNFRNFVFKKFGSHVLFIGNNMLTGQNAFLFSENCDSSEAIKSIKNAVVSLKSHYKSIGFPLHITSLKDFEQHAISDIRNNGFQHFYKFSTQPNMILNIKEDWKSIENYVNDLSKKYRDQYKRARKKSENIFKKRLSLEEIIAFEKEIYDLYAHVALNAPFNTFFLPKNHFSKMKEFMKNDFYVYGYFENDRLIGFNTLIKNGNIMETYFLGYDDSIQKEKMLYLNMLYDIIAYSIKKNYHQVVFARTALEIKSSVGAKPVEVFGFIEHNNRLINKNMNRVFDYLEPKTEWKQRNPFK